MHFGKDQDASLPDDYQTPFFKHQQSSLFDQPQEPDNVAFQLFNHPPQPQHTPSLLSQLEEDLPSPHLPQPPEESPIKRRQSQRGEAIEESYEEEDRLNQRQSRNMAQEREEDEREREMQRAMQRERERQRVEQKTSRLFAKKSLFKNEGKMSLKSSRKEEVRNEEEISFSKFPLKSKLDSDPLQLRESKVKFTSRIGKLSKRFSTISESPEMKKAPAKDPSPQKPKQPSLKAQEEKKAQQSYQDFRLPEKLDKKFQKEGQSSQIEEEEDYSDLALDLNVTSDFPTIQKTAQEKFKSSFSYKKQKQPWNPRKVMQKEELRSQSGSQSEEKGGKDRSEKKKLGSFLEGKKFNFKPNFNFERNKRKENEGSKQPKREMEPQEEAKESESNPLVKTSKLTSLGAFEAKKSFGYPNLFQKRKESPSTVLEKKELVENEERPVEQTIMKEDLVKRELRKMEGRKTEKIDFCGSKKNYPLFGKPLQRNATPDPQREDGADMQELTSKNEKREEQTGARRGNSWFVNTMITLGELAVEAERMKRIAKAKRDEVWIVPILAREIEERLDEMLGKNRQALEKNRQTASSRLR